MREQARTLGLGTYDECMTQPRRIRARVFVGVLLAASALTLAGCSSASTKPVTDYKGEPKGVDAPASSAGGAPFSVWLKDGKQFTVTAYGSSGCPPIGTGYGISDTNEITVKIKKYPKKKVCTMDYVPHTTVFETVSDLNPHKDVKVTVQDLRYTLPALPKK